MNTHEIERELQRPAPRQVMCRNGIIGAIAPYMIFLLPHMWIAVAAPILLVLAYIAVLFPAHTTGTVLERHVQMYKSRAHHSVTFEFVANDKHIKSTENVSDTMYNQLAENSPVDVYYAPFAPAYSPQIGKDRAGGFATVGFFTIWTAFWSGIMFTVAYSAVVPHFQSRWLCINGKPAVGKIMGTQVVSASSRSRSKTSCTYQYSAIDPRTHSTLYLQGEITVNVRTRIALEPGAEVTVLYNPEKPRSSMVYALGDYKAV